MEVEKVCCDCGSECQCRNDPCVLLVNWNLGQAAFGSCNVKYKSASLRMLYRAQECNLPEWYNGNSGWRPGNFYGQDGMPCGDTIYCYHKMCNNHNKQGQYIFDQIARSAAWADTKQLMHKEIVEANMVWKFNIQKMSFFKCFVRKSKAWIYTQFPI